MNYISAKDVLPIEIIKQIQCYVDGQIIYIPEYISGLSIKQLSQKYFLVEKSIQRIIRQEKTKNL